MSAPLEGVRVLDLSRVLSGPYATMTLADLGADVVKVERTGSGDDTRSFGPPYMDGVSTYFLSINRGKRSIEVDLKSKEGVELVTALAQQADVLVENFRPGVMERLGLGPAILLEANPKLVYCSISGFGRENPKPGYDLVVQGLSGVASITGDGSAPFKCGASIADLCAGMNAVSAILAALVRRNSTGVGGLVDVSMLDGQLSLLTYHASAWLNAGVPPVARGNAHPSIHPFRAFRTQDGWLNLAVGNDAQFERLCEALQEDWHLDARFGTNAGRVEHREALNGLMEPVLASRHTEEWITSLAGVGIPMGPVQDVPTALAEGKIVSHEHPAGGQAVRTLGLPYEIDGHVGPGGRGAPALGAHQEEVLRDWLGENGGRDE
ncbi:MAG: CoA transferase [Myxococcota bacterium]|nr:CoA transferase [Myxococcota bacterium]